MGAGKGSRAGQEVRYAFEQVTSGLESGLDPPVGSLSQSTEGPGWARLRT